MVTLTILSYGCYSSVFTIYSFTIKMERGNTKRWFLGSLACQKYFSLPYYATSLTSCWLSEFNYPCQHGNFPYFLLVYWYEEPKMTNVSCKFNFSGKPKEPPSSLRPLNPHSLTMWSLEAQILQVGYCQLWE